MTFSAMLRSLPFTLSISFVLLACGVSGRFVDARTYAAAHGDAPKARTDVIRPGDVISVRVFGEDNLSATGLRVRSSGVVTLPLLGEYAVRDKQPAALAKELEAALAGYVNVPHVTVSIDASPVFITVLGELQSPGHLQLEWPVTLTTVVATAGGLTQYANESAIFVLRSGERIRFDYQDIVRGEPHVRDFLMYTGDVVVVE